MTLETGGTAKRFRHGTHRVRPPEETWDRLQAHLPAAGITRVADVTALDVLGVPVYQAVRPASRNLAVSQGKGATAAAARVSAVMEALELWHAEDLTPLPQAEVTVGEMRGANAIPLSALRWSSGIRVPRALPLAWVRASSCDGGRHGWLPRIMLELDFRMRLELPPRLFELTSNGLASGNCREEALLHGLCELIERHALFLAREEPRRRIALAPGSIEDSWMREVLARVREAGMKLALWDVTWEAGVPVVVADLAGTDFPHVWRGSGCHPDPAVALSRALTEAIQSRLTYISGARDDLPTLPAAPLAHQVFDAFVEPAGERPFAALPDLSGPSVAGDLAAVVERLATLGLPAFFVDLTRAGMEVPVTISFVPGLREIPHG
ncbi:MAG TPA: YcaO-like family protein [Thermoanaerobaculia bacterium]|nr:YcaO-like family protein [Thermoanaerobaculia bacterium]